MSKDFNPYIVDFVKDGDVIENVEDGHSGAFIYKITREKEKYFLKVFNEKFSEEKIKKIKEYVSIYKSLKIKSLDIIDYGNIENQNQWYIVYNFINGVNLKIYTNSDKCTLEDVRKYGKLIGKELLKLRKYEDYDKELFNHNDVNVLVKEVISNFYLMLKDDAYKTILSKHFTIDDINKLRDKLTEYEDLLKNTEPRLIHGDIKRSNFMVSCNGELYIIDIESMQINYDIINFTHQMTWCLDDEKEEQFVKGYFDSIYNDSRPESFNKYVIFILIVNFFYATYKMYKFSQNEKFIMYVKKCRNIFEKINKKDLTKEFII